MSQVFDMLKSSYLSFDNPDYSIVTRQRESLFVATTIANLVKIHHYKDVSDENYDVAVILDSKWTPLPHMVYLSLVGNIAYIESLDSPIRTALSDVVDLLSNMGWMFLSREELSLPLPFPTELAREKAILFNVLFSDAYENSI
ncbi:hypothetical protein Q0M94_13810 [Deinococcus radiomollis]|uniref:hypothetical protein n=1 Tax=Deinococcus radiomollis TaxID=468916 RepID=UPI003891397A